MQKRITVILSLLTAFLLAACILLRTFRDTTPPEFTMADVTLTYTEGESYSSLLTGVEAHDNRNGDLTSSIRVYDVSVMSDNQHAKVIYAVYDHSGNMRKAERMVDYVAGEATPEEDSTEDSGGVEEGLQPATTEASTEEATEQLAEASEEEPTSAEGELTGEGYEDPELVSTGAPVIRLTTHAVTMKVGERFNSLDYIYDMVDDQDSRETLYRRIQLEGEYDMSQPGQYELNYYVLDTDRNQSNVAKLMLTVEE
jgi:hypothetical protein